MSGYIMVTRPIEDAYDYARELEAHGFTTVVEPMLRVEPLAFDVPDLARYQALIFTSANAVRVFAPQVKGRDAPVYAVGDHTRDEAISAGFSVIGTACGTGDDLARLIAAEITDKTRPLLHVRGFHVARPIDEMLGDVGITVDRCVAYRTVFAEALSEAALALIAERKIEAVTFFSKRTAENFVRLANDAAFLPYLNSIKTLCIGNSVLECVQSCPWQGTYIADTPSREGMLALLKSVCS